MSHVFKKVNYHIKNMQMLLVDASFLFVVLSFHYHFVGTPDINSKGNNTNALSAYVNVISSLWGIHHRHPRTKSSTVKVVEVSDFCCGGVPFPIPSDCCGSFSLFSGIAIRLHFDNFGKNKHSNKNLFCCWGQI